ncbi:putative signal transducing protein [Chloroflexota bacterium]
MKNNVELVEVYQAMGEIEAQVIKSKLESYGIPCVFKSNAASSVHAFTMDGLGEVKVMVQQSMAEKARQLIKGPESV